MIRGISLFYIISFHSKGTGGVFWAPPAPLSFYKEKTTLFGTLFDFSRFFSFTAFLLLDRQDKWFINFKMIQFRGRSNNLLLPHIGL